MHIPVGSHKFTMLSGRKLKTVTCAYCATEFGYILRRSGRGRAFSFLWLDADGAADQAECRASEDLAWRLARGCDPVRCPACGRYQADMVREYRRRRAFFTRLLLAIPLLHLTGVTLVACFAQDRMEILRESLASGPSVWVSIACLVLAVLGELFVRLLDPNQRAGLYAGVAVESENETFRGAELRRVQSADGRGRLR